MKTITIHAIVEGWVDYEIEVDENATVDEIETIAYEEMPTGGWEEYCVSWDEEDEEDYF